VPEGGEEDGRRGRERGSDVARQFNRSTERTGALRPAPRSAASSLHHQATTRLHYRSRQENITLEHSHNTARLLCLCINLFLVRALLLGLSDERADAAVSRTILTEPGQAAGRDWGSKRGREEVSRTSVAASRRPSVPSLAPSTQLRSSPRLLTCPSPPSSSPLCSSLAPCPRSRPRSIAPLPPRLTTRPPQSCRC
jgi:hypothetical protein